MAIFANTHLKFNVISDNIQMEVPEDTLRAKRIQIIWVAVKSKDRILGACFLCFYAAEFSRRRVGIKIYCLAVTVRRVNN